jgi:hypothetical protein
MWFIYIISLIILLVRLYHWMKKEHNSMVTVKQFCVYNDEYMVMAKRYNGEPPME